MYEGFGFQIGPDGKQSITLFIPDNAVDPSQYVRGGPSHIAAVSIIGDCQKALAPKAVDWSPKTSLEMTREAHPNGWLWRYDFPTTLGDGFYQYQFVVKFDDGSVRTVGDPCSKYGGTISDRSAFVIGGPKVAATAIDKRLPINDLLIYELMIDDFTAGYRGNEAPVDAVIEKLDGIAALGINAIEFMPWTAWPDDTGFTWGYNPAYFFSVESHYVENGNRPLERLSRLANLVTECHKRNLHVLLDIVLQHADQGLDTNGFPYYWLWLNPNDSPFIGQFSSANSFGFLPLDYRNACTEQFVVDVCFYWLDKFKLDGLRFDEVTGFSVPSEPTKGAPAVINSLRIDLAAHKIQNISLILEDSWGYDAVDDANKIQADGAWFDMFRSLPFQPLTGYISTNQMSADYMRALNSSFEFNFPISPVTYLENHDHSSVAFLVGGRANWEVTMPYAIALATCPGAPLLRNGQEWGQELELWEDDTNAPPQFKRVQPRPLTWQESGDTIGAEVRAAYTQLLTLRRDHAGLRTQNFYPDVYDWSWTQFGPDGYGIDVNRKLVIYHRYGNGNDGKLERFIVALNFAGNSQAVDIPFPINGKWTDLINENTKVNVNNFKLPNYLLPANWGCVFWIKG